MSLFFLHNNGQEDGPFYIAQLRTMWQAGSITADAYIREQNTDWQPITTLAEQLDKPAPPPYVPPPIQMPSIAPQPLKNPGVAAVLSFVFPALGQIYNGQIGMGLFFCLLTVALYFYPLTIIIAVVIHLYLVQDAYSYALKLNKEIANDRNA